MQVKNVFFEMLQNFETGRPVIFKKQKDDFLNRLYEGYPTDFSPSVSDSGFLNADNFYFQITAELVDKVRPVIKLEFSLSKPIYDQDDEIENFSEVFNHTGELHFIDPDLDHLFDELLKFSKFQADLIPTNLN